MTYTKTQILKMLQGVLSEPSNIFLIKKDLLQDIYTLLTEPYQDAFEYTLSEEGEDNNEI